MRIPSGGTFNDQDSEGEQKMNTRSSGGEKGNAPVIAEDEKCPWRNTTDQIALWLEGDQSSAASATLEAHLTPRLAVKIKLHIAAAAREFTV